MQIHLCSLSMMNYGLTSIFTCSEWEGPDPRLHSQKTCPLCRGGRNCQMQKIFLLSSSAADDWSSVKQTSDRSESRNKSGSKGKLKMIISHLFLYSISYLDRFLIFYINVSAEVPHSAPFQKLKSQFFPHQMSQYLCCRDISVLEMYWKLPAKTFENFAMGLLWLKLSWASSGLWKFPSLKFRTGIIRNTSGNSEGPPRICQTKWYSNRSGINNRNDPNKKVHLLETFCPERRLVELISCSWRPELMRYSDITSSLELASLLTSWPVITPPWHSGALSNTNTSRDILAHNLIFLPTLYS